MNTLEEQIINSFDDAAQAISLAFSNGDKTVINKHYFNLKKAFSKTKIHVTDDDLPFDIDIENAFLLKLLELAKNIDKKYNTTIEKNIILMSQNKYKPNNTNIDDYEFNNVYSIHKKLLDDCLVDKNQAYNIYKTNPKLFNLLILELYSFDNESSKMQKIIQHGIEEYTNISPILNRISSTYNIYTYQEILEFYNQLNALLLDLTILDENMQKTINIYRNQALKRPGLNNLSTIEIKKLISDTKILINSPILKHLLTNSHIKEFCKSVKIPLSSDYISGAVSFLKLFYSNDNYGGATTSIDEKVVCVFKKSTLYLQNLKDSTITHELIHAYTLNNNTKEVIDIISTKYKKLDEFVTEFLSRKAQNYLFDELITVKGLKNDSFSGYPEFDLLTKKLDDTPLMNTLIDIKVNNDYENIESRIEKNTLSLLITYLDDTSNINKYNNLISKIKNVK